ncbi:MAG: hypothetical protein HY048_04265 [Acidobacteria bacterium]|nr:hypothetical protein [Acidobacteriota bacterium]
MKSRLAGDIVSFVRQSARGLKWLRRNHAALTALSTFFLALITFLLAQIASRQNHLTETVQRAWLSPTQWTLYERPDPTQPFVVAHQFQYDTDVMVALNFTNSGHSPALCVQYTEPVLTFGEEFPKGDGSLLSNSGVSIFPDRGISFDAKQTYRLTREVARAFKRPGLYVRATIYYDDAFGCRHHTTACQVIEPGAGHFGYCGLGDPVDPPDRCEPHQCNP